MPRACWGSQSRSGRSQRRSSRFTLQFRRPNHPGVSSGGKRDRESTESRRLSSVAERSRAAPARPAVEGGRAASSATPFLPSVLWCGERQPCNRRSLARATRRRLSAVDAGHTPPGFVDRGGDQQEHGQVRGPNLMSAPALVTATRALPAGPLRGQARGNHDIFLAVGAVWLELAMMACTGCTRSPRRSARRSGKHRVELDADTPRLSGTDPQTRQRPQPSM